MAELLKGEDSKGEPEEEKIAELLIGEQIKEEEELCSLYAELDNYQIQIPSLTWDVSTSSSSDDIASFSNDNTTVELKRQESDNFGCAIATIPVYKFTVKIIEARSIDIGFIADKSKFKERLSFDEYNLLPRYCLFYYGSLSGNEEFQSNSWKHKEAQFKNGDLITFAIEGSTIHIYKNGKDLGEAFNSVKGPMFPFVMAYYGTPSCAFVKKKDDTTEIRYGLFSE